MHDVFRLTDWVVQISKARVYSLLIINLYCARAERFREGVYARPEVLEALEKDLSVEKEKKRKNY